MNAVLSPPARRPIRDLPDELISQIAAGEVVERPASVVRELLDNALDAGAMQVTVRLLAGGVRLISVEDDGAGIPREELPIALRRHATSKIASLADLESVGTMGFRGEAQAAIGSVAELSLLSRPAGQASAFVLDARSGELRPAARATGTTVEVRELFFSTPARRKFLKTDATELAHCIEAVRRHALSRPDAGFAVWHEGKLVLQWRPATREQRLADVLGEELVAQSVAVDHHAGAIHVTGRAGIPGPWCRTSLTTPITVNHGASSCLAYFRRRQRLASGRVCQGDRRAAAQRPTRRLPGGRSPVPAAATPGARG